MVGGVAVGAAEGRAQTAAQGVTGDPYRGVGPVQRCQPSLGRLLDHLCPYRPGADPGRAADGVYLDVVHPAGIDQNGPFCRADDLVAGGLHRNRATLSRREGNGRLDIGRTLRHHDHSGLELVVEVKDGAFVVVSHVTRQQNRTRHHRNQGCDILRLDGRETGTTENHGYILFS